MRDMVKPHVAASGPVKRRAVNWTLGNSKKHMAEYTLFEATAWQHIGDWAATDIDRTAAKAVSDFG